MHGKMPVRVVKGLLPENIPPRETDAGLAYGFLGHRSPMRGQTSKMSNLDPEYSRKGEMAVRRIGGVSTGAAAMLLSIFLAAVPPAFSQEDRTIKISDHLSFGFKTERMIASQTSYEFGNPFPPYQAPLSRLEFPLDSWWAGATVRASFPRFSMGAEVLTNIASDLDGHMKDSDWTDDPQPDTKTIYGVTKCRLEQSYMVRTDIDLKVSDWLGLPEWFDLRPVAGFRYQQFNLMAHDGTQWDLTGRNGT